MNDDTIRYHVSDDSTLTLADIARLDEAEVRLGESVDIPETPDSAWATTERGKHAAAVRGTISLHLDADVLGWLRQQGPDCAAAINRILRERMAAEQ